MAGFSVDIIQVRDTSFNIGLKFGQYIHHKPLLKVLDSATRPEIDYKSYHSIFSGLAPHLLDELEGLAYGLNVPTEKATALFSGYDLPKTEAMGCSAIVTKDYYVRNYDFSPVLYDGIFSLVQPEEAFATAGYNLQVLGRHDGINQAGLALGLHFVSNHGYSKGISPWTAIRMVLDTCSTVDQAIQLLKEIPHAACYNFSLGDRNGHIAVVEAGPEKVMVRSGEAALSCVNHFQNESLANQNRVSIDGSLKRNDHLQALTQKHLTHEEMFAHFKDRHSPLFFTDYDDFFGTLHTLSYGFEDSRIMTTIAQSDQVLDFNFADWVNGENLPDHKLSGKI
ncbi:hypothetical protein JNUCC1_02742 [Lentibacillus sp. JNUCC-1]|uniref:C45 family autoproteolytic acyltransferase/hydolase n=1 Tax=Lentibacillus sp. JNUCC-1 TaxID=2654513 RepID=UPI0012E7DCA7|nr:C45 family peptidase [Lentibacillus sp. JNUCC-1]MUV38871.1 hypothetical protein [Lentibacillus sp. JNUCC-1]